MRSLTRAVPGNGVDARLGDGACRLHDELRSRGGRRRRATGRGRPRQRRLDGRSGRRGAHDEQRRTDRDCHRRHAASATRNGDTSTPTRWPSSIQTFPPARVGRRPPRFGRASATTAVLARLPPVLGRAGSRGKQEEATARLLRVTRSVRLTESDVDRAPGAPFGLDLERDPTVCSPMRIRARSPAEVRTDIAHEKAGNALLSPLPNVLELVSHDVFVIEPPTSGSG